MHCDVSAADMCFRFLAFLSRKLHSISIVLLLLFAGKKLCSRHLVKYNNSNGHIASKMLGHTMGEL